jgi:hypothetical protein
MLAYSDCITRLREAGISWDDASALRRIAMTLHRWHELECGDDNGHIAFCLSRGHKVGNTFEYDDAGKPYLECHPNSGAKTYYTPLPDRERGALKRLAEIMTRYPGFIYYVQTDPRGASLYILTPDTMERYVGQSIDSIYNHGIAVYK